MRFNPILGIAEWIDDVLAGQNAAMQCQWRGAVVPIEPLSPKLSMSPLLQASHVKKLGSDGRDQDASKSAMIEPFALELNDGTLVSFLLVRGTRTNMLEADIAQRSMAMSRSMAKHLKTSLHSFGIHFLHDPMTASQLYDEKMRPLLETARRLGGNAEHFVADQRSRIIDGAAEEMILLSIRTHPAGLRKDEKKRALAEYSETLKKVSAASRRVKGLPPMAVRGHYGQALLSRALPLLKRHESLVATMISDFSEGKAINIGTMLLSVRESIQRFRRFADREAPLTTALPTLTGQRGSARHGGTYDGAYAPLALGMQALTKKIVGDIDQSELAQVGRMWYGTSVMVQGPASPANSPTATRFSAFMSKVRSVGVPVALSFDLLPQGLKFNQINQMFNAVLGQVSANNRQIHAAYKELKEHEEAQSNDNPVIGFRLNLSTWGPTKVLAQKHLSELTFAAQGWGGMDVTDELGAPDHAHMQSIPEYSASSKAPVVPAPLEEVLYLTPLARPSSPWDDGQMILKNEEGVLFPWEVGSRQQNSFLMGVCAPSGSGKTFFMNRYHSCMALSPGMTQIPYICLIDVAPGGQGSLRMLRTILPKSLHHQLRYFKVINDAKYCVNPFDLQLGCIKPTQMANDFIVSVMEGVFEGLGQNGATLINALIREAYIHYGPESPSARMWQNSYDPRVTAKLQQLGIEVSRENQMTSFAVTDAMMRAREVDLAKIAQRFAVPRLNDLAQILGNGRIKSNYDTARVNDEPLLEAAKRAIGNAVADFPIFSGYTQVDLDQARFIVIDLQSVVGSSSDAGMRIAGMMYLYARQLGAGNFFLDRDEMEGLARPQYQAFQKARVSEIQATPKILTYDEWHYVAPLKNIEKLNAQEARTTRKFRIYMNLVTQYATDFPQPIIDGMTTMLVVGAASSAQNRDTQQKLGLTDTDLSILNTGLNKKGKVWAYFKLNDGIVTALLQNDVGPLETWCYTSDDKDAPLRNQLAELIGEGPALKLLVETFRSGSAASFLDNRAREMSAGKGADVDLSADGAELVAKTVTATVARQLAQRYHEEQSALAA